MSRHTISVMGRTGPVDLPATQVEYRTIITRVDLAAYDATTGWWVIMRDVETRVSSSRDGIGVSTHKYIVQIYESCDIEGTQPYTTMIDQVDQTDRDRAVRLWRAYAVR